MTDPLKCNLLLRLLIIWVAFAVVAFNGAMAENGCPNGYEPWKIPVESQADCVAIPNYDATETSPQPAPPPATPPQWQDFAAAVAWADSDTGNKFVGVSKHFDEQSARETVLEKCRAKGWENCTVATSVVNGVIVIARDSDRNLRTRVAATESEARAGIKAKCQEAGVTCEVLGVFDGTAEYY
jgi:hypothetical protein